MLASIVVIGVFLAVALLIWNARRQSIINVRGRDKHFRRLADSLGFTISGDDYFLQLEGIWKDRRAVIYPHNFHGPGSITLFYVDTGIPFQEKTWIEPNLSLGRAIVEWKRGGSFSFEISGKENTFAPELLRKIEDYRKKYPFIAITLPGRFIFSHYLMESLGMSRNFIVLLVLDAGRKPGIEEVKVALDAAGDLASLFASRDIVD